ncbi:MAG: TonB family protein [candidate division Zixibacteria bacterium]|nr:TonB family protein [candidate division Zixibacteria bacterium]
MKSALQTPYGAYELKSAYQKNMMAGMASTVLLTALVIFSIWLYQTVTFVEVVKPPTDIVEQIIKLMPLPSIEFKQPQINVGKLKQPQNKLAVGIPVPVADDEIGDDEEHQMHTRDEKLLIAGQPMGYETGGYGMQIVDTNVSIVDILPGDFIKYEKQPEIILSVIPKYPRLAEDIGFNADVWIQVLVDSKGDVIKAQVAKCSREGMGFEEEAIRAALKCKYRPAIQNNYPVPCWISYKIAFIQPR